MVGERGEAIQLVKHGQIKVDRGSTLKATKVLIVLVKATDDQLNGVVGLGDKLALDAIDQLGPVAFLIDLGPIQRVWCQTRRQVGETAFGREPVTPLVAIDLDCLQLTRGVVVFFSAETGASCVQPEFH